jgi:hypothetical protein
MTIHPLASVIAPAQPIGDTTVWAVIAYAVFVAGIAIAMAFAAAAEQRMPIRYERKRK